MLRGKYGGCGNIWIPFHFHPLHTHTNTPTHTCTPRHVGINRNGLPSLSLLRVLSLLIPISFMCYVIFRHSANDLKSGNECVAYLLRTGFHFPPSIFLFGLFSVITHRCMPARTQTRVLGMNIQILHTPNSVLCTWQERESEAKMYAPSIGIHVPCLGLIRYVVVGAFFLDHFRFSVQFSITNRCCAGFWFRFRLARTRTPKKLLNKQKWTLKALHGKKILEHLSNIMIFWFVCLLSIKWHISILLYNNILNVYLLYLFSINLDFHFLDFYSNF